MDVRCTRCGTEYEFDDALISERGTSVRCTQCGFQFRVFPPQTKAVGPDEWAVLTSLGRRVVYRSLRELQNGISRGEVAREDLLARGTAAPRPLGSIAELDPLFAVKAAPERKSSTLTGVAPPPASAAKRAQGAPPVPADGNAVNPLREHHDTWSGVAPPAKVKALEEILGKPTAPMRVGSSTVLGLGTPTEAPPAPIPQAPEGRVFDGAAIRTRADVLGSVDSLPPETRGYEEPTGEPAPKAPLEHTVPMVVAPPAELAKPASPEPAKPEPAKPEPAKPAVPFEVMGSEPAILASAFALPEFSKSEPVPVEPPKPEPSKPEGTSALTSDAGHEPPTTRWVEPNLNRTLPEQGALLPKSEAKPSPSVDASSKREALPTEAHDASEVTRPRSRPKSLHSEPPKSASRSWGFALLAIALLGGGLYAGMQLVGLKFNQEAQAPKQPEPGLVPGLASGVNAPSASAPGSTTASLRNDAASESPWTVIADALEAGDYDSANEKLSALSPEAQASPEYQAYRILADAMSADLLWWQLRLLPKTEARPSNVLQTTLVAKLDALAKRLDACRTTEACKTQTQSAQWALCRMQGKPELAQRPKQGTVDATGLYQLAMLDWPATGSPEGKTLDRLTKARLAGVEQGPRVTALIVALIDSKRFDDARAELAKLATAAKAHPHLEALNQYLKSVEQGPADAGVTEADTDEMDAQDPDLREPDFRIRLQRAAGCLARNELTKAQKLLRSVLAQRPNDIEALTGAADILRRRGSYAAARTQYDKVLSLNGNYLPALVGAAEVRWQSGDRAGAIAMYRRVVDRVGEGPGYGQQAANRIKEFEGGKSDSSPTPEKAKTDGAANNATPPPASDDSRKAP